MSTQSLHKFARFLEDPTSFAPDVATDGDMFVFSMKFRIRRLTAAIREGIFQTCRVADLIEFVNSVPRVEFDIFEYLMELLQISSLVTLDTLPSPEFPRLRDRIDTLCEFRSEICHYVATDPYILMRLSLTETEVFVGQRWIVAPTNYYIRDVFSHMLNKRQTPVIFGDKLVFLADRKLGYISIFSPIEEPRYSPIPPGGPDLQQTQVCVSSLDNMFLVDLEARLFAAVDKTFQIGCWRKLDGTEYERESIPHAPFDVVDVRMPDDPSCHEYLYLKTEFSGNHLIADIEDRLHVFDISSVFSEPKFIPGENCGRKLMYVQIPTADNGEKRDGPV